MGKKNIRSGAANSFDRRYLETNLVGTQHRGSEVKAVTNKYIITENQKYEKKGYKVTFEHKEGTEVLISTNTQGDTAGDQL